MECEGWSLNDQGNYIKVEKGATRLELPAGEYSGRRVVRDTDTSELIDMLDFNWRTSKRRRDR